LALRKKWAVIIGDFTFDDIVKELEKPGRDPRDIFKVFQFRDDIFEVKDLKENMICPGLVTNVTNFGAFVDIGVHQDGLVHISELSNKFVEDPRKVVNPGDQVTVRVLSVDLNKNQIALSMKMESAPSTVEKRERPVQQQQGVRPQTGGKNIQPQRGGHPGGGGSSQQRSGQQQRSAPVAPRALPFNNPFAALQGSVKK
jgi:uncharacterized protein